jgi:hypothetical protein
MIYDFIEIGTSNIETLIEHADDNTIGLIMKSSRHWLAAKDSPYRLELSLIIKYINKR